MRAQIHGRRRGRSPEIPWLLVATIVGIVVVVVAALFFASGLLGSSSSSGQTSSGSTVKTSATSAAASSSGSSSSSTSSIVIATTTPVTVSGSGVSVKVDYVGSYSGTYTTNGETTKIKNSGTRVFEITNATGTVTAVVQKSDNTATHALTVGIYKDGTLLKSDSTSTAYGNVTVSASV